VTDSIFVAGDIARAPHVLYEYQFLVLEHWDNAVFGGMVAAHNMVSLEPDRWPHLPLPAFWSGQFGVNIKGVGVGPFGDEIVITQGSVKDRRFAAAYGRKGRIVAASWPPSPSITASGCPTTENSSSDRRRSRPRRRASIRPAT
jgi:hypothetical protein